MAAGAELRATVETMLAAAGLEPSPSELDELVLTYAELKPRIEALHDLEDARYEVPALTFRPR